MTTEPAWTLTDRLRKAREHKGLQQTELAAATGISERSIQNYEAGRTTPRRPQLIAWAMATGVSLSWLEGPDAARPKGLEPLTFWTGVCEHDGEPPERPKCERCGRGLWDDESDICEDCVDELYLDLAVAA